MAHNNIEDGILTYKMTHLFVLKLALFIKAAQMLIVSVQQRSQFYLFKVEV